MRRIGQLTRIPEFYVFKCLYTNQSRIVGRINWCTMFPSFFGSFLHSKKMIWLTEVRIWADPKKVVFIIFLSLLRKNIFKGRIYSDIVVKYKKNRKVSLIINPIPQNDVPYVQNAFYCKILKVFLMFQLIPLPETLFRLNPAKKGWTV